MGKKADKRRQRRVNEMHAMEKAGMIQADTSRTVHDLGGGWRIAELITVGDVRRECFLMRNCTACYIGDTIDYAASNETDRTLYAPSQRPNADLLGAATKPSIEGMRLMSLRAPDNLPHLTFWASTSVKDVGAYRNNPRIPDKYLALLDAWIEAAGLEPRPKVSAEQTARQLRAAGIDLAELEFTRISERLAEEDRRLGPMEPWTDEETERFHIAYSFQDSTDPYWVAECEAVGRWLDRKMQRMPIEEELSFTNEQLDDLRVRAQAEDLQRETEREARVAERMEAQANRWRELMII